MKTRIYNDNVDIKTENTRKFYDMRAEKINTMDSPYMSVLLGDQNPVYSVQWNEIEKEIIYPKLGISSNTSCLDIGCGMGRWAEFVIPVCGYYYGVDFSAKMIETATKRNAHYQNKHEFECKSFNEVTEMKRKEDENRFNVVIMCGVCMYVNDNELEKGFKKFPGLLADKCRIYFTETVALKERLTLNEFYSDALKATYDVIYRTPDEYNQLYKILLKEGFNILEQDFLAHLNKENEYLETERWYTIFERK